MKRLVRILPLLLLTLMFSGCGEEEVTYRTLNQIQEDGTVNIAFSTDQYPFMNKDTDAEQNEIDKNNDKIYRLEEALIGDFVKRDNVKVNLIKTTRDETVNLILDGTADVAFGKIEKNESDKFKVNQSLIFANEEPYVITNKGVSIFGFEDFKDKKVALISGSPVSSLVKSDVSSWASEIKQYKNINTAVEQLLLYNIDAIVCYKNEAVKILNNNADTLTLSTIANGNNIEYVALVANGNETLLTEVNDVINEYFYPTEEEEEIN